MPKVLVSGVGLIGASIGLGLRSAGWEVVGWDPRPESADEAWRRGALDRVAQDPDEEAGQADVLVLAGPLSAVVDTLARSSTARLVTDVAGVKGAVVAAARHLPHFVGGHPMAGGTTTGPSLASSQLFRGASWILTTDDAEEDDLLAIESLASDLGANPIRMTAAEHDHAVARASHLPHLVAASLMGLATGAAKQIAGGGFRDLTRVAGSATEWWPEVLTANAGEVGDAIAELTESLRSLGALLATESRSALADVLDEARQARQGLGEHNTQIRVILVDQPGELARIGRALDAAKADVRDIQLRHGEHGGGGVLTISASQASANRLRAALAAHGFILEV